jgi:adenosylcobyric acid synthase
VAGERGLDWKPGEESFAAARETQLEKLGDLVADHVDREAFMRLIDEGAPRDFPVIRLQATGYRLQEGEGEASDTQAVSGSNGDGPLTGPAEPANLPATTLKDLKPDA